MNSGYTHAHIESLQSEITQLKKAISDLRDELHANVKSISQVADATLDCIDTNLETLYPRLVAVEHHLFPHISRDLQDIGRILGPRDPSIDTDRLDRRPTEKP